MFRRFPSIFRTFPKGSNMDRLRLAANFPTVSHLPGPRCRAAISSTLAQGYWYARPMPADDLLSWLQQRSIRQPSDE